MRTSGLTRKTNETKISLSLSLDGSGKSNIVTGCGFFDHMLTQFAKHSKFDLYVSCESDTDVDYHHTVEDVAMLLGRAFNEALGDRRGINRFADATIPMDDSLILAAVDISGRGYLAFDVPFLSERIGDFDVELVEEFFMTFVRYSTVTLHLRKLAGNNSHHTAECLFKAFARVLRDASSLDSAFKNDIPSAKGVLR